MLIYCICTNFRSIPECETCHLEWNQSNKYVVLKQCVMTKVEIKTFGIAISAVTLFSLKWIYGTVVPKHYGTEILNIFFWIMADNLHLHNLFFEMCAIILHTLVPPTVTELKFIFSTFSNYTYFSQIIVSHV